ncbi:hypothetical protein C8J56DRAFT_939047 [Mycena floridula]|nr:hypothetical protein C8J56DRAFT_939047 [Mycena floridula]
MLRHFILIAFLCGLSLGWVTFALGLIGRRKYSRTGPTLIFAGGMAAGWLTITIMLVIRKKFSFTRIGATSADVFNPESMLTYRRQGLTVVAGAFARIFLTSLAMLVFVFGRALSILAKEAIPLSDTLSPSTLGADSSDEGGTGEEEYVLAEEEPSGKSTAVLAGAFARLFLTSLAIPVFVLARAFSILEEAITLPETLSSSTLGADSSDEGETDEEEYFLAEEEPSGKSTAVLAGAVARLFLTSLAIPVFVFGRAFSILEEAITFSDTLSSSTLGADSSDEGGTSKEEYILAEEEPSGKSTAVEVEHHMIVTCESFTLMTRS